MKKKEVIKKSCEFDRMIASCPVKKNKYFLVFYEKSQSNDTFFGITVPKKSGKAVVRNFLKRRTREIISFYKKNYPNSYNCIIIIRKTCVGVSFEKMQSGLLDLLQMIEKEQCNEKK